MAGTSDPGTDPAALLAASERARQAGTAREGARLARLATERAVALGQPALAARAQGLLAQHLVRLGEIEAAVAAGQQGLSQDAQAHDPASGSMVHSALSMAYERAGLFAAAVQHGVQALELARLSGDRHAECWALNRLGCAFNDPEDDERGLQLLRQSLALARELGQADEIFAALNNLSRRCTVRADQLARQGEPAVGALRQALAWADEAEQEARASGQALRIATALSNQAGIHRRLQDGHPARQAYEQALQLAQHHGYGSLAATLRVGLAAMAFEQQPSAATREPLETLLQAPEPGVDTDLQMQAWQVLVHGCQLLGDADGAFAHLQSLHQLALRMLSQRSDVQSRLLFNRAELDQARQATEQARLEAEVQRLRADAEQRAARQLALDRDQLEREVALRTAELQRAKVAAEAASRTKSDFLSTVSHELRTPLNGLLGMTDLARRRATDPRQVEQLRVAAEAGQSLRVLVDGILAFLAADETVPAARVPTDLRALLADVRQRHQAAALAQGFELRVEVADDLPAVLPADPGRLTQVLGLLLGNALKFGTPGVVQLRAGWAAVPPQLHLEVADSGPGISPKARQHLFEPLKPGDESNTRSHGGLGLGLATAQRLVRSLDGCITVDSPPGAGTTFRVVLPAG